MANESVVAAWIADLKSKLEARLAVPWPTTTVYTCAPMDKSISLDDSIVLVAGKIEVLQDYATNVRARNQEIVVPMMLQASSVDANDAGAAEAFSRADALLSEIIAQLRDDPPGAGDVPVIGQRKSVVSKFHGYPFPPDGGGWGFAYFFDVESSVRVA